jgi:hypothetical protein
MARTRVDQAEIQVERETVVGDGATFAGGELSTKPIQGATIEGDAATMIESESTDDTGGKNPAIKGVSKAIESMATLQHYVEGLVTAAGDGVVPAATGLSEMLASWAQQPAAQMVAPTPPAAPTWYTTGSTVEPLGSTTISAIEVAALDVDFFELPTTNAIGVIGYLVGGKMEWRPYTWDTATNTAELLIDASGIPADGSTLYAVINYPRSEKWTVALPFPLATRIIGNNNEQNREFPGSIYDWSIPEAGHADVPRYDFTSRAFTHVRDFADTKNGANVSGSVMAKGRVYIAKAGQSTYTDFCAFRCAVNFSGPVQPDGCINDSEDRGISGYSRVQGAPMISVSVGRDVLPPAGLTDSKWIDVYENQGDAGNDVHVFVVYGSDAGRTVTKYLPNAFLDLHTFFSDNDLGYQKLDFVAKNGPFTLHTNSETSELLCHAAQG